MIFDQMGLVWGSLRLKKRFLLRENQKGWSWFQYLPGYIFASSFSALEKIERKFGMIKQRNGIFEIYIERKLLDEFKEGEDALWSNRLTGNRLVWLLGQLITKWRLKMNNGVIGVITILPFFLHT